MPQHPEARLAAVIPALALGAVLFSGSAAAHGNEVPEPTAEPKRGPIRYGRDVRPLLSDRCFKCHGNDEAERQAGLRLDQRTSAVAVWPTATNLQRHPVRAVLRPSEHGVVHQDGW